MKSSVSNSQRVSKFILSILLLAGLALSWPLLTGINGKNVITGWDTWDLFTSNGTYWADTFLAGYFPTWNPMQGAGISLLPGIFSVGFYSPFFLVFVFLRIFFSPEISQELFLQIICLVGALGNYFFLRRMNVSKISSTLAALVALRLCYPSMYGQIGILVSFVSIPWVLFAMRVISAFPSKSLHSRVTLFKWLASVFSIGLLLNSLFMLGYPVLNLFAVVLGALFFLVLIFQREVVHSFRREPKYYCLISFVGIAVFVLAMVQYNVFSASALWEYRSHYSSFLGNLSSPDPRVVPPWNLNAFFKARAIREAVYAFLQGGGWFPGLGLVPFGIVATVSVIGFIASIFTKNIKRVAILATLGILVCLLLIYASRGDVTPILKSINRWPYLGVNIASVFIPLLLAFALDAFSPVFRFLDSRRRTSVLVMLAICISCGVYFGAPAQLPPITVGPQVLTIFDPIWSRAKLAWPLIANVREHRVAAENVFDPKPRKVLDNPNSNIYWPSHPPEYAKLKATPITDVFVYAPTSVSPIALKPLNEYKDDDERFAAEIAAIDGGRRTDKVFSNSLPQIQCKEKLEILGVKVFPSAVEVELTSQTCAGALVHQQAWSPFWKAETVSGHLEVHRANLIFMAVQVPADVSKVRFFYSTPAWLWGTWVFFVAITAACLLGACVRALLPKSAGDSF